MADKKITGRKRFRSNFFHPKVKKPITLELTEVGHKLLTRTMNREKKSSGDVFEKLLREHARELTFDDASV